MEKTLVLIKPDAFAKHYSGDIIKRYEEEGFRIVLVACLEEAFVGPAQILGAG